MATNFNFLAPPNQNELGAAFGYYPQIRRNRMYQDPRAALEMPLQLARGRVAATVGAIPDFLNTVRSPMPMEMFGQVDYGPQPQVPYGSQELLKTLPLAPRGPAQQAAAQLGALVPMTPAEALQAARLVRQAALAGRGLPVGMGTEAVGGMEFLSPQPAVMSKAEERLRNSKDFKALKGQEKDQAIEAFRAKQEGTGVSRSMAELKAAVGGEEDIARSLMQSPAFKISGVVPRSVIDDAVQTRSRMRAEPATTPGPKASEADWKAWGEKHGVNMTLTEPKSLGITDLTTKREIRIPGGLEGTFTVPDMFWMKANNIDPASLPKKTHDELMQKLIRTHEVQNPDQVDMFNRLNFALLSPNAPLTPNEFLAQRMRLTNMDELQALAGRVGEPGLSRTAQQQTGVQAAGRGGMGVLGTADLGNQAMLAKLILDKPDMFQIAPGETMRDVTMRVMNQVPGLGPKTASLGTPWLNLEKANTSAVDLHMIRNSYERMLDDPIVGEAFRARMAGKLKTDATTESILGKPVRDVEKAAIDVIGGSSLSKTYRTKSGELNEIPGVATPEKLAYEPKQLQDFNPFYKRVVDYVDESRGPNPTIELFPEQWRKWDVYRQRLEPHEFAHPDYRLLPRQSWTEMQDALTAHKKAGYTQANNPVMAPSDWRELYYGRATPAAMLGTAGAAAAGIAAQNMLAPPARPQNMLGQELPPNP